jgi:hypothetical protein
MEILRPSWTAAVFLHEWRAGNLLLRRNEHGYEQHTEGKRGELTSAHWFCKRLLRRPCTGRHQRVLRGGCGGQVHGQKRVWMRVSASPRRYDGEGLLQLRVHTENGPLARNTIHVRRVVLGRRTETYRGR